MSNFSLINKRNIKNSSFYLDEKESHHIISVLRLKKDDKLTLTDGEGNIYYALINDINKLKTNKTLIIISHRMSVLENCDRVYEVKNKNIYLKK